jgi:hypothetical protein
VLILELSKGQQDEVPWQRQPLRLPCWRPSCWNSRRSPPAPGPFLYQSTNQFRGTISQEIIIKDSFSETGAVQEKAARFTDVVSMLSDLCQFKKEQKLYFKCKRKLSFKKQQNTAAPKAIASPGLQIYFRNKIP